MHIVEKLEASEQYRGRAGVAIGNFEGLHRGHLAIIRTLVAECGRRGLASAVMTFRRHPLGVVGPSEPERLVAPLDKIVKLAAEGVDLLLYLDFTPSFAALEPCDFLRLMNRHLAPRLYCLGTTFRFGRENRGDLALLRDCREEMGYHLLSVEEVPFDGGPVSSTRIREEVRAGRFEKVRELLGTCYYTYLKPAEGGRVRLFIENWALPGPGSYRGDLEDLESGARRKAALRIEGGEGDERALFLESEGGGRVSVPSSLYRFYFVRPCREEK